MFSPKRNLMAAGLLLAFLTIPPCSFSELIIREQYFTSAEMFPISDFMTGTSFTAVDLTTHPLVFSMSLKNTSDDSVQVILEIVITSANFGAIATVITKPFWMTPHQIRTVTNRDFSEDGAMPPNDDIEIEHTENKWGDDLEDVTDVSDLPPELQTIFNTGYFPTDTYFGLITMEDVDDRPPKYPTADFNKTITILNPTAINLIAPGGDPSGPVEEIYTTFPLLQWESTARRFLLKICEKLPENTDPLEVMNNDPNYETPEGFPLAQPFYQIPTSGIRPFEPGHTYYWQVITKPLNPLQDFSLQSDIWAFRVAPTGAGVDTDLMQVLAFLEEIFGGGYTSLLSQVSDYSFTGLTIGGQTASITDLNTILQRFRSDELEVVEITFE